MGNLLPLIWKARAVGRLGTERRWVRAGHLDLLTDGHQSRENHRGEYQNVRHRRIIGRNDRQPVSLRYHVANEAGRMNKQNVFISWSGERSKFIADAFYEWLPMAVQSVKPWMSSHSIGKGSRGALEIAKALDGTKVGLTCLTPENLTEPWILYEAGCLSKTIDDSTRLCTYLLGGLKNEDIEPPLGQFQHTSPSEKDTRALVHTINKAVGGDDPLKEKMLDDVFDQLWPLLDKELKAFPAVPQPVSKRSTESLLAEILDLTRSEANRSQSESMLAEILWFVRSEKRRNLQYVDLASTPFPISLADLSGRGLLGPITNLVTPSGLKVVGSAFDSSDAVKPEPNKEPKKTVFTKTKKQ